MTDLETLRCRVRKLLALLDDPHPDKATWQESYQAALESLAVWWTSGREGAVQRAVDAERRALLDLLLAPNRCLVCDVSWRPAGACEAHGRIGNHFCPVPALRDRVGHPGALEAAEKQIANLNRHLDAMNGALETARDEGRREGREAGIRIALKVVQDYCDLGLVDPRELASEIESLISEEQPK